MAPHIVSFLSAKGGSGKTVTSSALATFLSALKFKILLIDVDAATNGLTLLFLEQLLGSKRPLAGDGHIKRGLFEQFDKNSPVDVIGISDYFSIVPATFRMADTEQSDPALVSQALENLIGHSTDYDFIFLDAQAGADTYARMAAGLADTNIIVSEYDPVSSQGVERLKVLFGSLLDPANTWTLFNKVLPEFTTAIGEGLTVARFLPPIPWDADVVRAFTRRDLAINLTNPNPYTFAIAQAAFLLSPDTAGSVIAKWRSSIAGSVTSPVEDRIRSLDSIERQLERGHKRERWTIVAGTTALFGVIGLVFTSFSSWISSKPDTDSAVLNKLLSSGNVSVLALIVVLPAVMDLILTLFPRRTSNSIAFKMLNEEREKLTANLHATKASLRLNEQSGFFASLRQDNSGKTRPERPH